jgi:hypothetical protein
MLLRWAGCGCALRCLWHRRTLLCRASGPASAGWSVDFRVYGRAGSGVGHVNAPALPRRSRDRRGESTGGIVVGPRRFLANW